MSETKSFHEFNEYNAVELLKINKNSHQHSKFEMNSILHKFIDLNSKKVSNIFTVYKLHFIKPACVNLYKNYILYYNVNSYSSFKVVKFFKFEV